MSEKRPTPLTSPFAVTVIVILTIAFTAALAYSLAKRDWNGLIAVGPGMPALVLFWLIIRSGLRVAPGRYVGGGPMFHKVDLQPSEHIEFDGPFGTSTGSGVWSGGHLFVTNSRIIVLPFRFLWFGQGRSIRLQEIVTAGSRGSPRKSHFLLGVRGGYVLRLRINQAVLEFWPGEGPGCMGLYPINRFCQDAIAAMQRAGWSAETNLQAPS